MKRTYAADDPRAREYAVCTLRATPSAKREFRLFQQVLGSERRRRVREDEALAELLAMTERERGERRARALERIGLS
ncbi:MAG: hypothetical protein ACYDCK_04730 [Thermoplasmatota archaeon]